MIPPPPGSFRSGKLKMLIRIVNVWCKDVLEVLFSEAMESLESKNGTA